MNKWVSRYNNEMIREEVIAQWCAIRPNHQECKKGRDK